MSRTIKDNNKINKQCGSAAGFGQHGMPRPHLITQVQAFCFPNE